MPYLTSITIIPSIHDVPVHYDGMLHAVPPIEEGHMWWTISFKVIQVPIPHQLTIFSLLFFLSQSALDRVMERLKKSSTTQNVLRAIESRDRSIQENNFERVNMWSGIQIFVMISVALTHVLMIRGLFSDHSKSRHTRMAT